MQINKKIITIIIFLMFLNIVNGCIEQEKKNDDFFSKIEIKNLNIFPKITIPDQPITISVDLENLNNSYIEGNLTLKWDDGEKIKKIINLNPFESRTITWEISEHSTGIYNVTIESLNDYYEISDRIAWFKMSDLFISSNQVEINEIANISVLVENIGYSSDFYTASFSINEALVETKLVKIGIGEKKNISFNFKKSELGKYNISINDLKEEVFVVNFKNIEFRHPLIDEPKWKIITSTGYNMFEINWRCDEKIIIEIYEISGNEIELYHKSLQGEKDGSTYIIIGEKYETLKTSFYGLIISDIYNNILYKNQVEFKQGIINLSISNISTIYTDVEIMWEGTDNSFPIWICSLRFYLDNELIEEKNNINWIFHNPKNTTYYERIYHYGQSIERGNHDVKIILYDCFLNKILTFNDNINYI